MSDRTAWLIERRRGGHPPYYLIESVDDVSVFGWTPSHDDAMQSPTEHAAQSAWRTACDRDVSLRSLRFEVNYTEHQWGDP